MKIETQKWVDRYIGQSLCAALSLINRLRPKTLAADGGEQVFAPRAIAILMLSEMGSMVLAQPMVNYVKARYPKAQIHVVQLGKNQEIVKLLAFTNPAFLHAIDDTSLPRLLVSFYRLIKTLRSAGVDAVIDCELFARISSIIAYLSGAKRIAGFTAHTQEGLYRGSYINCAIPYNPYRAIKDQFLSLARALELPSGIAPRSKPVSNIAFASDAQYAALAPLTLGEGELAAATKKLLQAYPQVSGKPLVLLYPGGGILPIRAWPAEYFVEVAKSLLAAGCAVGFIGLPVDRPLAQSMLATLDNEHALDLTGYTKNIRELLVLFFYAKLLITNDGGPGHFAALTPIHTIVFFGPETPALYAPLASSLGGQSVTLFAQLACSPCLSAYNHRSTSCDGHNLCLQAIGVDQVLSHAHELLGTEVVHNEAAKNELASSEAATA